jgi:hypothetical protein
MTNYLTQLRIKWIPQRNLENVESNHVITVVGRGKYEIYVKAFSLTAYKIIGKSTQFKPFGVKAAVEPFDINLKNPILYIKERSIQ